MAARQSWFEPASLRPAQARVRQGWGQERVREWQRPGLRRVLKLTQTLTPRLTLPPPVTQATPTPPTPTPLTPTPLTPTPLTPTPLIPTPLIPTPLTR